jgi:hypothetical protein
VLTGIIFLITNRVIDDTYNNERLHIAFTQLSVHKKLLSRQACVCSIEVQLFSNNYVTKCVFFLII